MKHRLTRNARKLRTHSTDAERLFWSKVRAHRLLGYKFKRQQPVGSYIVDFICSEWSLIVELDGGQHAMSETDVLRDSWLRTQGFQVLRFWNNDVMTNIEGVLEVVIKQLRPSPLLPDPLPQGERE